MNSGKMHGTVLRTSRLKNITVFLILFTGKLSLIDLAG